MQKTFVLDTNVLLHNPNSLFVFEDNHVVLPLAVIEEIDDLKKRQDEIGANARTVSRILDKLRGQDNLAQGVSLKDGGSVRIEINHCHLPRKGDLAKVLDPGKPDNRILAVALNLARKQTNNLVTLVSKDLNLRLKADVLGLPAEDLINDRIDSNQLFSGHAEVLLPQSDLDAFFQDRCLDLPQDLAAPVLPNQFLTIKAAENPSASALARMRQGRLQPLALAANPSCFGLKSRNREQLFALELLLDPEVGVVTLAGGAGTGKTLLALAAGLELVLERNLYDKILVTRPVIPLEGQDLGYLPGDKAEKVRPWMQPIYDNLQLLFQYSGPGGMAGVVQKVGRGKGMAAMSEFSIEEYLDFTGQLELEALTYIRGRSISRRFIIVDEAQNCTSHAMKTLLTRVGQGSKIVFTGDIDQIDQAYLDSASNGLTIAVEKLKYNELAGHVTLMKGERSAVAELGAKLL